MQLNRYLERINLIVLWYVHICHWENSGLTHESNQVWISVTKYF